MWLLVFIFLSITVLLGWTLFIYFVLLYLVTIFRRQKMPALPDEFPDMTVVIPCYNEGSNIALKVSNLKDLDYPRNKLMIIFADGGSADDTLKILRELNGKGLEFEIISCPESGKINQLNFVLPGIKNELIVNSDVDADLDKMALKWIAAEFNKDPDIGVVGAFCHPFETLEVEDYYWAQQNKSRLMESDAHSTSIVIAQCYAFRKELIESFPKDVVADDIYIAFIANVKGKKAIYSRYALARETRTPQSYSEFLPHKFRKSNAYLRESLRFLYCLPEMKPFFKMIFVTRLMQQVFLPWGFLSWALIAGVLLTLKRYDIVIFGSAVLGTLFFMTVFAFSRIKLPSGVSRFSLPTMINGYIITNIIMLATGLSYPFFRQNSLYDRIGSKPRAETK
jgi:poly-beta-1,6-N-acetyl-D-glucosamine synthase